MQRRVRKLRLSAVSEADVRRGATLVEDALRTASLPDDALGKLLVFRTLSVGTIHLDRPPSSVALAIERRVRALATSAVYALDPAAPSQSSIYFHDDAEPFVSLAVAAARGQPLDAWFWPSVVPGLPRQATREEALRAALVGSLASKAGPAALLRVVVALREARALAFGVAALRREDATLLLRAIGHEQAHRRQRATDELAAAESLTIETSAVITHAVARWGEADPRTTCTAVLALAADRPARLADPRLGARAVAAIAACMDGERERTRPRTIPEDRHEPSGREDSVERESMRPRATPEDRQVPLQQTASVEPLASTHEVSHRDPEPRNEEASPNASSTAREAVGSPAVVHGPPTGEQVSTHVTVDAPGAAGIAPTPASASPVDELQTTDGETAGASTRPSWQPTELGGLLFLIPVLARLGIAELLEREPDLCELELVARLLLDVAGRVRVAPEDPLLVALAPRVRQPPRVSRSFALPARFHDATAPGPRMPAGMGLDGLSAAFIAGARRIARRSLHLGLREIVVRPGRLVASSTHIDVLFDHEQTDLGIRRAGLDVDPGWVPWLGRVVRFHYAYGD